MATAKQFEDLEIWKLAREIAIIVFATTKNGNLAKDFDLKNQMNRSSGSIMDNIAEGFGRGSRLEFIHFLTIANGSCEELKSQLYRSFDREYINKELFEELYELADKIFKKTHAMINYLNQSQTKGHKFRNRTTDKPQSNDKE
jgi:four helix bundle protein